MRAPFCRFPNRKTQGSCRLDELWKDLWSEWDCHKTEVNVVFCSGNPFKGFTATSFQLYDTGQTSCQNFTKQEFVRNESFDWWDNWCRWSLIKHLAEVPSNNFRLLFFLENGRNMQSSCAKEADWRVTQTPEFGWAWLASATWEAQLPWNKEIEERFDSAKKEGRSEKEAVRLISQAFCKLFIIKFCSYLLLLIFVIHKDE